MFFAIEETLREVDRKDLKGKQYVAVMSFEEWLKNKDTFEMVIDIIQYPIFNSKPLRLGCS